jgi:CheY-like chemotaxis protein
MKIATREETEALGNLAVLVLEDDMMVAMLLEDMLAELGCQVVGPVANVEAAFALIHDQRVDAALLDVNLNYGQNGYPVADALARRGIPFAFVTGAFVTGYGAGTLDPDYRDRPTLQKPFHTSAIVKVLIGMARARV